MTEEAPTPNPLFFPERPVSEDEQIAVVLEVIQQHFSKMSTWEINVAGTNKINVLTIGSPVNTSQLKKFKREFNLRLEDRNYAVKVTFDTLPEDLGFEITITNVNI